MAGELAEDSGGTVTVTHDPYLAALDADVVYTDVWLSMGDPDAECEARRRAFHAYAVDEQLMRLASPTAMFLHCLPADRGYEVEAAVIDGPQSVIWNEADNRLHAQKALLVWLVAKAAA